MIHTYVHTYVIHTHIHTCIHTYIHTYTNIHTHTQTHTYIHTHGAEEGKGGGEKEEVYALYSSPNIIWMIEPRTVRWLGQVVRMGERRGAYRVLVENPEGKRPVARPRHKWECNCQIKIEETDWDGVD